jgi:hypothetical protein
VLETPEKSVDSFSMDNGTQPRTEGRDRVETPTEFSDLNLNSTSATQMSDSEATGALVYVIIFLVFYTSSIGMLILYNVNHHKKISEHEELKSNQREYERSQQLIELRKREEVYLHYKMLYGQESGIGTPTVDETGTPEPKPKKLFSRSFSFKEIPKFSKKSSTPNLQIVAKSLQSNLATLPGVSGLPSQKKRQKRFSFRPRQGSRGFRNTRDSDESKKEKTRQFSLGDPESDDSVSGDDDRLATQTWHPSSMTHEVQKMLQDIKKKSDMEKGICRSTQPEVSRVFVLKKNLQKDRKSASAEEVQKMIPESGDQTLDTCV